MGKESFLKKLEQVNSKDEIVFKIEYKGKVLHKRAVEVPEYAKGVMEDKDLQLYYFFKDMAVSLEEKIIQVHKKQMWKEINKGEQGDGQNDKSE